MDFEEEVAAPGIPVPEACKPHNVLRRFMKAYTYPQTISYGLGCGPETPDQPRPANAQLRCDCSALVNWCHRIARRADADKQTDGDDWYKGHGGYANTDGIRRDALQLGGGRWDLIPNPVPGCVVVYGAGAQVGHVGIWVWSHPSFDWTADAFRESLVGHCSLGNDRRYGKAIQVTSAGAFYKPGDTVFAVWSGWKP